MGGQIQTSVVRLETELEVLETGIKVAREVRRVVPVLLCPFRLIRSLHRQHVMSESARLPVRTACATSDPALRPVVYTRACPIREIGSVDAVKRPEL